MLEVFLSHREHITGVSKEHITSLFVFRHILILTLLEVFQLSGIITLYPACLIEMDRFPTALGIILVL